MAKATKQPIPKVEASISTSPAKETKRKLDPPDDFWMNAEELPGDGNIYGGPVLLPDGRRASVYMVMGKDDIEILEVNIIDVRVYGENGLEKVELISTDIFLSEPELLADAMIGEREATVKRYIFEQIIPYYYNKKAKIL